MQMVLNETWWAQREKKVIGNNNSPWTKLDEIRMLKNSPWGKVQVENIKFHTISSDIVDKASNQHWDVTKDAFTSLVFAATSNQSPVFHPVTHIWYQPWHLLQLCLHLEQPADADANLATSMGKKISPIAKHPSKTSFCSEFEHHPAAGAELQLERNQ